MIVQQAGCWGAKYYSSAWVWRRGATGISYKIAVIEWTQSQDFLAIEQLCSLRADVCQQQLA